MNQLVRSIAVTAVLLMLFVGMTVMADATPDDIEPVKLPDYILSCYDPYTQGFGDQPGYSSTLDTTLHAVNLLVGQTDPKTWSKGLIHALDTIVERYTAMQSWNRAGFQLETQEAPDFRTSALILETLQALDRLDSVDVEEVLRYLWSSYRYSLTFDSRWFTEGDFDSKYWALRTAYVIEDYALVHYNRSAIGQLGLSKLDLDLVLAPDMNRADFIEHIPYLTWGELLFEESEIFGGGFENEPYDRQLQIIESFQLLLDCPIQSPAIVSMLVDTERLANNVASHYNQDNGMFRDDSGEYSYDSTSIALTTLELIGRSEVTYDPDWASYRLIESTYRTQGQIDDWYLGGDSLTALDGMYEVEVSLDRIDERTPRFYPVFGSGESNTGIKNWHEMEYTPVFTASDLWVDLQPDFRYVGVNNSNPIGLSPLVAIIALGLACSLLKDRRVISLLSVLIICLFLVQTLGASALLANFEDVSSALFQGIPRALLDMSTLGTTWLEMTYPESNTIPDNQLDTEEVEYAELDELPFLPSDIGTSITDIVRKITNNIKVFLLIFNKLIYSCAINATCLFP